MADKFVPLSDTPSASTRSGPAIALLPAGGAVWEDFLDTIGISLETFCREGPGGWILGYIDALTKIGVRTVLVLFSSSVRSPLRFIHEASGTTISVLPVPRIYLAWRQSHLASTKTFQREQGFARRLRHTWAEGIKLAALCWSTPLLLLARELRREGCRAILCQEYEDFRFDVCTMLGMLMHLPVFATFQGTDFEPNPVLRRLRPITIRKSPGLFIAPKAEIQRVRARYDLSADRVKQVFNPVDLGMWNAVDRREARASFNLSPDLRVAVWHGRIAIGQKGLDILLDAWEQVCRERPRQYLQLVIMGAGEDGERLHERITSLTVPNVRWINEYVTDRTEIRRLLSAGDVYAFPSRWEGFAVAPIEAMACGLPVVAARATGVADIFDTGEAAGGVVVPCGDAAAFGLALGRVLDDESFGRELGRRARCRVEEAFSLEAVGRQLKDVLTRTGFPMESAMRRGNLWDRSENQLSSEQEAMDRDGYHRPQILPVAAGVARPLWSVMIPTYNCAGYLRETLAGVLAQDPGSDLMQIEVLDDCSTLDDPEEVVAELGGGRVAFYRQPKNIGHVGNFNACIQRSQGHLIHLLHGDDYVRDGFYMRMQELFERHPAIGAAFCRHTVIDELGKVKRQSPLERSERGILDNWLERIASELPLQPPSMVVRREVYEDLGGFDNRLLSCGEDWEMWVRIAVDYTVGFEPEILASYRDNLSSLTKRHVRSGQNIRDVRNATQIVSTYLPQDIGRNVVGKARESWANWALSWAELLIAAGDLDAASIQAGEALLCSRSDHVVEQVAKIQTKIQKRRKRAVWLNRLFKRNVA